MFGLQMADMKTYHHLDNLLRLHPVHRKAVHLYDPVACVKQTYTYTE